MNSDFMRWLLNVKSIPKGSESLHLAWEHPWPNWAWALLLIGVALFALWSYSQLAGRSSGRTLLACTRFLLLTLVLVLIAGPMLVLPRETVEQDWAILLADRSASMNIKDGSSGVATDQARTTRDDQLKESLTSQRDVFAKLGEQKHVAWMGFHSGAFNLASGQQPAASDQPSVATPVLPELGEASGRRTMLESALEQALQRAAARPVSGVVVFSDGRTDDPPGRTLIRRLIADAIPVYVVPLGSETPLGDLAIRSVEFPRRAFVRDKVPVVVEIEGQMLEAMAASGERARLKLIDQSTGEELDSRELDPAELTESAGSGIAVTLTAQPQLAGEATWTALIETASADLIPENNSRAMVIELIDRPLRVLYVEGYPRWEYRYVKNLLVREKSVESSVMLISADRDFAQEGNQPITRLPRSSEEFAAFDVIILGDVPASFFSPAQLDMIRGHVAERGAGLLWIAGPRALPSTYAGTALADLLPMRGSLNIPPINEPVTMTDTPLAERLGVLHLAADDDEARWPEQLADSQTGWSQLYYAQRIEPGTLKPAAEVLAQTARAYNGANLPLVVNMRYGAGQSMYVATDEIWRWRYGRGELLHERFWVQIVRMLGRESIATSGEGALLEVNPRRAAVGQPMRIELRLLDAQLISPQRTTVRVVLEQQGAAVGDQPQVSEGSAVVELDLQRVEGSEDRYVATYLPDSAGTWRASVDDPTLANLRVQAPVEVFSPDDELQKPQADHDLLRDLAESTGGRVLKPDELHLLSTLPNRAVRTINPLTEPIWDSPLALIMALLLLTLEWIGRKVLRLV